MLRSLIHDAAVVLVHAVVKGRVDCCCSILSCHPILWPFVKIDYIYMCMCIYIYIYCIFECMLLLVNQTVSFTHDIKLTNCKVGEVVFFLYAHLPNHPPSSPYPSSTFGLMLQKKKSVYLSTTKFTFAAVFIPRGSWFANGYR